MKDMTTNEEKTTLFSALCDIDTSQNELETAANALALACEMLEDESNAFAQDPTAGNAQVFANRLPLLKSALTLAMWQITDTATGLRAEVETAFDALKDETQPKNRAGEGRNQ